MYVDQIAIAIYCRLSLSNGKNMPTVISFVNICMNYHNIFFFFGSVASLPGHDHSSTLLVLERDSIVPICEKLTYYSFGPFWMEMRYKEH